MAAPRIKSRMEAGLPFSKGAGCGDKMWRDTLLFNKWVSTKTTKGQKLHAVGEAGLSLYFFNSLYYQLIRSFIEL